MRIQFHFHFQSYVRSKVNLRGGASRMLTSSNKGQRGNLVQSWRPWPPSQYLEPLVLPHGACHRLLHHENMVYCPLQCPRVAIWRHNSVDDQPICIKFGRPVQNHMPMAVDRSKSKPEVEFQDSGRLFTETSSSNIWAVDWDIWPKFGMPVALDLPKRQIWPNQKPEVDLRRYIRHHAKSIWRHNYVGNHPNS